MSSEGLLDEIDSGSELGVRDKSGNQYELSVDSIDEETGAIIGDVNSIESVDSRSVILVVEAENGYFLKIHNLNMDYPEEELVKEVERVE